MAYSVDDANVKKSRWIEAKQKGEQCFSDGKYNDAINFYSLAINQAEIGGDVDSEALAKLYSNRSVSYLMCAKTSNTKKNNVRSLKDAETVITLNEKWWKGYLRRASALHALNETERAVTQIKELLQKVDGDTTLPEVRQLMNDVKYYTTRVFREGCDLYNKAKFKENFYVVDQFGAGDYTEIMDAVSAHLVKNCPDYIFKQQAQDLSILVMKGEYERMIGPPHFETEIVGAEDGVVITGEKTDILISAAGRLLLRNVSIVRPHNDNHDPNYTIPYCVVVEENGRLIMSDCTISAPSVFSAVSVLKTGRMDIENSVIKNSHRGAYVTMEGQFHATNCRFEDMTVLGADLEPNTVATFVKCVFERCDHQAIVAQGPETKIIVQNCKLLECAQKYSEESDLDFGMLTLLPTRASCIVCTIGVTLRIENTVMSLAHPNAGGVCLQLYTFCNVKMVNCKTENCQYGVVLQAMHTAAIESSYLN